MYFLSYFFIEFLLINDFDIWLLDQHITTACLKIICKLYHNTFGWFLIIIHQWNFVNISIVNLLILLSFFLITIISNIYSYTLLMLSVCIETLWLYIIYVIEFLCTFWCHHFREANFELCLPYFHMLLTFNGNIFFML